MIEHHLDSDLTIRLLQLDDVDELFALTDASRDHLRPWFPWVDFNRTSLDTRAFVEGMLEEYAQKRGVQCGIRVQDRLAGTVGLENIDLIHRRASLDYWLGPAYQGRGIMAKAGRALLNEAFDEWDLNRVDIVTAVENTRSRILAERLGFVQEGVLREYQWMNGRFVDYAMYSILQREWSFS